MSQKRVVVFGGGNWKPDDRYWKLGEETGASIAELSMVAVTGGYSGAMEAVCKGATESQGKSFAYLHVPPDVKPPNKYVQDYKVAEDYLDRMANLLRIHTAIALPGSSGTLAEIIVSLALMNRHEGRALAIYTPYWLERLAPILESKKGLEPENQSIFWFDQVDQIRHWLKKLR